MNFPARWRDWVALLLSSASSTFMFNGDPGPAILHQRGLQQGDPLLPILFILAIDTLHRLLEAAQHAGAIAPLPTGAACLWVTLYADDAIFFANPVRQEID
uniref:Reverse transcriptase domain-containing protein n=1 Tax=Triticum urartu TaxID=4572 RepID=A0A8R7V1V1_TRIUA